MLYALNPTLLTANVVALGLHATAPPEEEPAALEDPATLEPPALDPPALEPATLEPPALEPATLVPAALDPARDEVPATLLAPPVELLEVPPLLLEEELPPVHAPTNKTPTATTNRDQTRMEASLGCASGFGGAQLLRV